MLVNVPELSIFKVHTCDLGPVVQSIVSLTISVVKALLSLLIHKTLGMLIFLVEK